MSGGRYLTVSRMAGGHYFPVLEDTSSSSENIDMVSYTLCLILIVRGLLILIQIVPCAKYLPQLGW